MKEYTYEYKKQFKYSICVTLPCLYLWWIHNTCFENSIKKTNKQIKPEFYVTEAKYDLYVLW